MLETKWEFSLSKGLGFGIIALSMVLLTGYAGEINLAPLAFAGIGALSAYQFDVGTTVETGAGTLQVSIVSVYCKCLLCEGFVSGPCVWA